MKANKSNIVLIGSFITYCVWIIISAIQHEPSGDEYHVWSMVRRMTLSELWSAMSTEGHFILWHILQWPFIKWFGMDYHCIYIVSVSLMVLAAWLLLFRLNLNVIGKLLILFSFPFCYYFPVVSRCYALIPPILIGIAILYQKKQKPLLYCILLGLLANTHVYMEGLVAVLWCLFVYNQIIMKFRIEAKQAKQNIWFATTTIILVLFAFFQVVDGLIAVSQGFNPPGEGVNKTDYWFQILNGRYHFKLFNTVHKRIHLFPVLDVLVIVVAWVFIVIGCYEHIKCSSANKIQMLLILIVGIGWQMFFACNIYGMNWQRIDLLYFVAIFVLWISYEQTNNKWTMLALASFWLLNTPSQYVMIKDVLKQTGGDAKTAAEYASLMVNDAPLYTNYLVGVHDLMDRDFTYVRFYSNDTITTEKSVTKFIDNSGDCYLLIMDPLKVSDNKWDVDTLVALNHIEYGYHLYYIKKKEDEAITK